MSHGLNVKLVVSHGGLSVGADGGSHQQIEDIAITRAIPNMRVLIPADTTDSLKTAEFGKEFPKPLCVSFSLCVSLSV